MAKAPAKAKKKPTAPKPQPMGVEPEDEAQDHAQVNPALVALLDQAADAEAARRPIVQARQKRPYELVCDHGRTRPEEGIALVDAIAGHHAQYGCRCSLERVPA